MSVNKSFGILMSFGQTQRPADTTECPYHCSAGPDDFVLEMNEEGFLEITAIKNSYSEMLTEGLTINSELFAIVKTDSLSSNVDLLEGNNNGKLIDGSSVLQNAELNMYGSIIGKTNFNRIAYGTNYLKANVSSMMRYWNWKIKRDYDCTVLNTDDLADVIYKNFITIMGKTRNTYDLIIKDFSSFDLTVYINLITATISSFSDVITNYIKNEYDEKILHEAIDIDNKLKQIDPVFYTAYKTDDLLNQVINRFVDTIRLILIEPLMLLDENEELKDYCFFTRMITLNEQAKKLMGNNFDVTDFNSYFCGKIGAIYNLSFIFECMRLKSDKSSSGIYLFFALPQKFAYLS